MILSKIATHNLNRDKGVLGKKWFSVYNGWFSNKDNINSFIDATKKVLSKTKPDVLYVASASGLLGEKLLSNLGGGTLTIVDISRKHLKENKNPKTKKIAMDLLTMDLKRKFDLVIMRSSLDYFPSKQLQIKVLRNIKRHLKSDGIFINQPAYISNLNDRNLVSKVYNTVNKIGKRFFQSKDLDQIYRESGFSFPQKIGRGSIMRITEKDHIRRYRITPKEVKVIQNILKKSQYLTNGGYSLKFEFPIFVSK